MKKFDKFVVTVSDYMRAGNLVNRWNLLNSTQKKNAYDLKKEFGWKIDICIQQVLFFGNTVEREKRLFGK